MHFSGQHGAPNIDAIGHIGRDGKLFGGIDAAKSTEDPDGIGASGVGAQLAIDQFPKHRLIERGVLLDVASMINGNLDPLPAGYEIRDRSYRLVPNATLPRDALRAAMREMSRFYR